MCAAPSAHNAQPWLFDLLGPDRLAIGLDFSRMIPAVDRVLNYVHQRTIQRLTLEAVRTAQETRTGVGGVRLDDAPS